MNSGPIINTPMANRCCTRHACIIGLIILIGSTGAFYACFVFSLSLEKKPRSQFLI